MHSITTKHVFADSRERSMKINRYLFWGGTVVGIFDIISILLDRSELVKANGWLFGVTVGVILLTAFYGIYGAYLSHSDLEKTKQIYICLQIYLEKVL